MAKTIQAIALAAVMTWRASLLKLTPETYSGNAEQMAKSVDEHS